MHLFLLLTTMFDGDIARAFPHVYDCKLALESLFVPKKCLTYRQIDGTKNASVMIENYSFFPEFSMLYLLNGETASKINQL